MVSQFSSRSGGCGIGGGSGITIPSARAGLQEKIRAARVISRLNLSFLLEMNKVNMVGLLTDRTCE
jgi:hypothetical protein